MDTTIRFLSSVVSEDFKTELPMPNYFMRQRGYRRVRMPGEVAPIPTQRPMDDMEDVEMSIDSPSEAGSETDGDEDTRIIFHPPRGAKLARGQRTRCTNKLYEDARLARAHKAGEEFMTFQFQPTLTWYSDQVAEGRGFEFINVESWTDINRDLGIEKAQDPRNIKAAQEGPGYGITERKGSVTSG
jgi:chromo domain-containing protein 1